MDALFAENLRRLRTEKGLSQAQLGEHMFVTQSTIARWENGSRLPDAAMISRLCQCLGVDVNTLLYATPETSSGPNVILVDDLKLFLSSCLPILEAALPGARIMGFTRPSEAVEYARSNTVALAFLDIELGRTSGMDLCRKLLKINPHTNVVFLTAYSDYSLDAWSTGASGFMLKPVTLEDILAQLKNLRHPFMLGGAGV